MKTSPRAPRRAFSLIELIIVIAVIAIIATFTIPAMNTLLKGSYLSQGAGLLVSQMNIARQQAISRNRQVELRFYRFADPEIPGETVTDPSTGKFRALQIFEVRTDGVAVPLDKIQRLPGSIVFSWASGTGISSLIDGSIYLHKAGTGGDASPRLPRGVDLNYEYVPLRFMPDGSTDRSPIQKWFVTVIDANSKQDSAIVPPPNFFTVQVDPVSGTVRNYRPTAG